MHARHRDPWRFGLLATLGLLALSVTPGAAAPPGAATLLGPSGLITGTTHTFTWQAGSDATFYYLQVNDATSAPRYTAWYPAAQACPGGSATCFISLSLAFASGGGVWWVQTWNPESVGPWSAGMSFTVAVAPGAWSYALPAAERFQLVLGGGAVLDRETGLVWERTPSTGTMTWNLAVVNCPGLSVAGRKGWRLPSLEELASLVDQSQSSPALPAGHPFNIGNLFYWSASVSAADVSSGQGVNFASGFASPASKASAFRRWCVRGGQTPPSPQ